MRAGCKAGLALFAAILVTSGCTPLSKGPPGPPNFAPDPGLDEAYGNSPKAPRQLIPAMTPDARG
jgi:hypothetical protein